MSTPYSRLREAAALLDELHTAKAVWQEVVNLTSCTSPDGSTEISQLRMLLAENEKLRAVSNAARVYRKYVIDGKLDRAFAALDAERKKA